MMGAHVLEQARLHATQKLVIAGTICAYPKFAPVPFHEEDLWNGYPEETNAPYGVAKKAILVGAQAYREQYGTNAIFLLPVNLYGPRRQLRPRDVARDPRADPEDGRGAGARRAEIVLWGDGTPTREFLYVDDCVDGLALAARALRRRRPRQPRHRRGDRDRRPRGARARRDRLRRRRSAGTRRSRTASRAGGSTRARRGAVRLHGCGAAARRHRADGRLVPGATSRHEHRGSRRAPTPSARSRGWGGRPTLSHGTSVVALAAIVAVQILATVALVPLRSTTTAG